MSDGNTGPQYFLGEQEVLSYAGGLKPKNEELSGQERSQIMVKADRRRRQHRPRSGFSEGPGIVGRAEGSKLPCFSISRTGEKMVRSE